MSLTSLFFYTLPLAIFGCLIPLTAGAQITADGTTSTTVKQNGNNFTIEQGNRIGDNLFHSFEEFSVPTLGSAAFNNAGDIANIFSRVTGSNISSIDGLLSANGGANLFLINPNGIIFGENARLDLGGSFFASTADSLIFEGDRSFSATNPQAAPLLEVNIPIGINFRDNPGDIVNRSFAQNTTGDFAGLEVLPGENLTLVGGDIKFEAGKATAIGGNIELGGLSAAGKVGIGEDNNLSFPNDVAKANIFFTDNAVVDITSDGGGSITVNADNLDLTGESLFLAGIGEGLGSENAVAGAIQIDATRIFADNSSQIRSDNLGIGQAGIVNINTDTLDFDNNSAIVVSTFGQGDAGTVNITAQDVSFEQEWGGIYSSVGLSRIATDDPVTEALGNGGEININTNTLELANAARISVNSVAQGNGGNINITATGEVSFSGEGDTFVPAFNSMVISGASSQVLFEGVGNSGQINIEADSLNLDTGAVFVDNSGEEGDAGDITLDIQNNISLDQGALILAQVLEDAVGNGGDINITANSYESKGGSSVSADNQGMGDGGNININIEETISLNEGSRILTELGEEAVGNAGGITITTNSLNLNSSSNIVAQTEGKGDAGEISITANEAISLENESQISSQVISSATGNGGDITLTSGELNLTNESRIIANTDGQSASPNDISRAGNIDLVIAGDINLDNGSQIQSQVGVNAVGDAGDITIKTDGSLISTNRNKILTGSKGKGNGGDIQIIAGESIEIGDNSQIIANTSEQSIGDAGKITLEADNTFSISESSVLSQIRDKAEGNAGGIDITANMIDINNFSLVSTNAGEGTSGKAGSINLNGINISINSGSVVDALTENDSNGGNIVISGNNLEIVSGGVVVTSAASAGNAGRIDLDLTGDLTINGERAMPRPGEESVFPLTEQVLKDLQESTGLFETSGAGNAGNITITTGSLTLTNGGQVNASTFGQGNAGDLDISAGSVEITDFSVITTETFGEGNAGSITIDVTNGGAFNISNSLISTGTFGKGNAGDLYISTGSVKITDFAAIAAVTFGEGNGGNLDIRADSVDITDSSQITVETSGTGDAGDVTIDTGSLTLTNGGEVNASTFGQGNAGNVTIDAGESITISGVTENNRHSRLSANALESSGKGGNITVDTNQLTINNGGIIEAGNFDSSGVLNPGREKPDSSDSSSVPGTGQPGKIKITANSLSLSNYASINAATQYENGESSENGESAEITLEIADDIFLRNSSLISARALKNAKGGNIEIDADLIIAFPNQDNDIIANAEEGKGGKIKITAKSLFGIEERSPDPITNDIDASSEFGLEGTISINTPDFNPTSGLIELPEAVGDATDQISQNICEQGIGSEFIITGKGGLPPNPNEILKSDEEQVGLVEPVPLQREIVGANGIRPESLRPERPTSELELVPAQGWIFNDKGEVTLTSYRTPNTEIGTPNTEIKPSPQQQFNSCPAP